MNDNALDSHHLYPAILTDSIDVLAQQLSFAQEMDEIETVQIDVIDGFFVDNLTVTPDDLVGLDLGELKLDFHFMVNEPSDFVMESAAFKSELPVRAMIGQIEHMGSQAEFLQEVKRLGWLRGLSLDLHTPLEEIDDNSWQNLDVLQLMGVEAGAQNQQFSPFVLEKIKEARKSIDQRGYKIELIVDGGVKLSTIEHMLEAGVDSVAIGSALWEDKNPQSTWQEFLKLLPN